MLDVAIEPLDLLGGVGGPLRERAHFGGHHGEPAAEIAGARRLDPGVERQQVGLERDLVDDPDDFADLARRAFDPLHRVGRVSHDLHSLRGNLARGRDGRVGLAGAVSRLRHPRRDLAQRGRRLLEARRLLLGALRQVVRRDRDLLRSIADRLHRLRDAGERLLELLERRVEISPKRLIRIRQAIGHAIREVLLREVRDGLADPLNRERLLGGEAFPFGQGRRLFVRKTPRGRFPFGGRGRLLPVVRLALRGGGGASLSRLRFDPLALQSRSP